MADTTVKYFNSTMTGAPVLSGTAGSLIGILDACLVNGFGSVTLDSLVVAANVATGTISTGHNFAMIGNTGPVVTIAGATPAGLNGEWRIASVPGSTTFTFATTGIADQTATGTITAKRSPAGFSKAFSGTNKAAYRSNDIAGTRLYLRVDDTPAQYPTLIMYETMSDVDTGTGRAPTTGSKYFGKSTTANGTGRPWRLFADSRFFYLFGAAGSTSSPAWVASMCFGDAVSYMGADPYLSILFGNDTAATDNMYFHQMLYGILIARAYTQLGAAITGTCYSHQKATQMGSGGQAYPAPSFTGLLAWPVELWDSTSIVRGRMPALWNPIHTVSTSAPGDGTLFENFPAFPAHTLISQYLYGDSRGAVIDLTGPWR